MPQQTEPANPPMRKWLALTVLAVIVAGIAWLIVGISTSNTSRAGDASRDRMEAILACETRIEDQLRSPSTADFDSRATLSGGTWTVAGTVDSENALGGTVRSDYTCTAVISAGQVTTRILELE